MNCFPFTNFHELNLDWILQTVKTAAEDSRRAAEETAAVTSSLDAKIADAVREAIRNSDIATVNPLKNKDVIFYGDSRNVHTGDTGKSLASIFAELTGCNMHIAAIGGSLVADTRPTNNLRYQVERVPPMRGAYCFVQCGINDFRNNINLGAIDTERTDNFFGGIEQWIKSCLSVQSHPVITTILPAFDESGRALVNSVCGMTYDAYNLALRDVAARYRVPVIDLAGICNAMRDYSNIITEDDLHYTEEWNRFLAFILAYSVQAGVNLGYERKIGAAVVGSHEVTFADKQGKISLMIDATWTGNEAQNVYINDIQGTHVGRIYIEPGRHRYPFCTAVSPSTRTTLGVLDCAQMTLHDINVYHGSGLAVDRDSVKAIGSEALGGNNVNVNHASLLYTGNTLLLDSELRVVNDITKAGLMCYINTSQDAATFPVGARTVPCTVDGVYHSTGITVNNDENSRAVFLRNNTNAVISANSIVRFQIII